MKLKKGSAAAKAFMAKIRAAKGKTKPAVKAKAKKSTKKIGAIKLIGSFQTTYTKAPADVKKIIDNLDTSADYRLLIKAQKALTAKGYFIDYDLNGEVINFKKIDPNKLGAIKKRMPVKKTNSTHKDTKSHNVNISVVSGINRLTINEYLNQVNPSYGKLVKLNNIDVQKGQYIDYGIDKIRYVIIKKLPEYTYVQLKGDDFLYTQDQDGNPKRKSVFLLSSKLK
jgi:hypothetical protein